MYYQSLDDLMGRHAEVDDPTSAYNGDYGEVVGFRRGEISDWVTLRFPDGVQETFLVSDLFFSK